MINYANPIIWKDEKLYLLDQRILPRQEVFLEIKTIEECHHAIKAMVVRGAPCIGFTAILGLAIWAKHNPHSKASDFFNIAEYLKTARPTAINLAYEINRTKKMAEKNYDGFFKQLVNFGLDELHKSESRNLAMAKAASEELSKIYGGRPLNLMTHCNTGRLACGGLGTALGVISYLHSHQRVAHVFADETRPYMQGSRLTSYELSKENIPHSIVVEGAASYLMKNRKIDAIFVGADRIVANGDTANKVGTSTLAIVANHYKVPFYVVAPLSSFDISLEKGEQIEIELRDEEEILSYEEKRVAPLNATALNPSFDVTNNSLITGIICEHGLIKAPYKESIKKYF